MEHLVFQLHGPMASWGMPAVGEDRPTAERPTRSAILGLLAASLGLRRSQQEDHDALRDGYGVAIRLEDAGSLLRDYHTAQVPSRTDKFGKTRKDELSIPSRDLNTILSSRDYRSDFLAFIALWVRNERSPWTLQELADALDRPRFRPYLGRRSCPPGLPFAPRTVDTSDLKTALSKIPKDSVAFPRDTPEAVDIYWDQDHPHPGLEAIHRLDRRDQPLDRTRWRFSSRTELHGRTTFGGTA